MYSSFLLFCLTLLMSQNGVYSSTEGEKPVQNLTSVCTRQRAFVPVHYPGCNSTTVAVPICHGACISWIVSISHPPYFTHTCNSCVASSFATKRRRVVFDCDGVQTQHRVYFPHALECGCISNQLPLHLR